MRAEGQDEPPTQYSRSNDNVRVSISDITPAADGCPFSILHYWRPCLGCFPDAMHTIGGVIKDLVRMLMGRHRESRLTPNLEKYYLKKNRVNLKHQDNRKWEAGKWRYICIYVRVKTCSTKQCRFAKCAGTLTVLFHSNLNLQLKITCILLRLSWKNRRMMHLGNQCRR